MKKSMRWYYEEYIKRSEQNRIGRFTYKDADILISEGGPYYISDYPLEQQAELKDTFESAIGWYESTYAIWKGEECIMWQPISFDFLHDTRSLTENARVQGRINAAVQTAKEMIDANPQIFETTH